MPTTRRVAVITGSSSGIEGANGRRMVRSGYGLMLSYSENDERAASALAEWREVSPDVILVKADVSNPHDVSDLMGRTVESFGRIDGLVNNAARVIDKPALEMTENEWDTVMNVNLKGAFICSQHAARQMMKQHEGGVILNIGASTGLRGRRNGVNPCPPKPALMLLPQSRPLHLAPKPRST